MAVLIDHTIKILEVLNSCEPRKVGRTDLEAKAQVIANWCLGCSFVCFLINVLFVLFYDVKPPVIVAKTLVTALFIFTTILALAALLIPVIASLMLLVKWKVLALGSLCEDVRHEQRLASKLEAYGLSELKDARFWLERRVGRISASSGRFFGEKTAVVGLLATSYSFVGEFGGLDWVAQTLAAGFKLDNLGNTLLLWVGAFLFGFSIGSILLGCLAARYRYQIEILDVALRNNNIDNAALVGCRDLSLLVSAMDNTP
ncbi:hypothetical protein [Pseudomonas sp. RW405]|jgi:hypothetical protein|uniref:hypothetical protein n=1 Tax=Pseudomonas sp. RW405 TaxID=2202652 RepID=UPI0011B5DAEF|nr:hypothetical protein [Pseudomonas sp. RW405]